MRSTNLGCERGEIYAERGHRYCTIVEMRGTTYVRLAVACHRHGCLACWSPLSFANLFEDNIRHLLSCTRFSSHHEKLSSTRHDEAFSIDNLTAPVLPSCCPGTLSIRPKPTCPQGHPHQRRAWEVSSTILRGSFGLHPRDRSCELGSKPAQAVGDLPCTLMTAELIPVPVAKTFPSKPLVHFLKISRRAPKPSLK